MVIEQLNNARNYLSPRQLEPTETLYAPNVAPQLLRWILEPAMFPKCFHSKATEPYDPLSYSLSLEYARTAGRVADQRIMLAGYRLAELLKQVAAK
jgi:hypothetical protein